MRLIVEFTVSNGVESWDQVQGIEYESKEKYLADFSSILEKQYPEGTPATDDYASGDFVIASRTYEYDWFVFSNINTREHWLPDVYTVDEWFDKEQSSE